MSAFTGQELTRAALACVCRRVGGGADARSSAAEGARARERAAPGGRGGAEGGREQAGGSSGRVARGHDGQSARRDRASRGHGDRLEECRVRARAGCGPGVRGNGAARVVVWRGARCLPGGSRCPTRSLSERCLICAKSVERDLCCAAMGYLALT
eukprot:1072281-Rhodomonas_salina.7